MRNQGEVLYKTGMAYFGEKNYEQTINYLVKAYELGYKKAEILEHLYTYFIFPNEDEFKSNYVVNSQEITKFPYDELMLDFIPISAERYYIFDKKQQEFAGVFELEKEPIQRGSVEFRSIMITGIWDIREIITKITEKNWDTIYILLEGIEEKFSSFLKLPRFKELYLANVLLFKHDKIMRLFFEEYEDFYLPKELVSTEAEKYLDTIRYLHNKRLCGSSEKRENIFLSICIPSYNRGKIALENVLHLLQCPYDSEIEIIISNNGSTKEVEEYKLIQKLSDNRVRYHEFEKNNGFATNVLRTLEMAKGKYAVLVSDEDLLILENMDEYLSYLKANGDGGVFYGKVIGANSYWTEENRIYNAGLNAISEAISLNYITGITYNMKLLRNYKVFDMITNMRGNEFLETYIHMVLAAIIGKFRNIHFMNILLWDAREKEEPDKEKVKSIRSYMFPQNRIQQFSGILELLNKGLCVQGKDFQVIFLEQCQKIYGMLQLAYTIFEEYKKIYTWEEICFYVFREEERNLDNFFVELGREEKEILTRALKEIFLFYLCSEDILKNCSVEEIKKKKILHYLIKMELDGYAEGVVKVSMEDDLFYNLKISIEELIGKKPVAVEKKNKQVFVNESHLLQSIFKDIWEKNQGNKTNIISWDV